MTFIVKSESKTVTQTESETEETVTLSTAPSLSPKPVCSKVYIVKAFDNLRVARVVDSDKKAIELVGKLQPILDEYHKLLAESWIENMEEKVGGGNGGNGKGSGGGSGGSSIKNTTDFAIDNILQDKLAQLRKKSITVCGRDMTLYDTIKYVEEDVY